MSSTSLSLDQTLDKKALRRTLRQRRRALTSHRQIRAEQRLASRLAERPEFVSANTLALYLAADGEIGTRAIIELAWQLRKRVYLPILRGGNRLRFAEYRPGARLYLNRLGIPEPLRKRYRAAKYLDLVLMPFVEKRLRELSAAEQQQYVKLLESEDTELFAWFLQRQRPENPELTGIVDEILAFARRPQH